MPAVSQSQQKLMAQAYAVKKWIISKGKEGLNPEEIDDKYREKIENLANSMTKKELKDFAETDIKNLPKRKKVKENLIGFLGTGPFPHYYSYAANISPGLPYANRDNKDPLVKKFMDFIEDKKLKESGISAVPVPPGVPATANNTSGVGNVVLPSVNNTGSGDRFDNGIDNIEDKIGIMSYNDYKKWLLKWKNKKNKKNDA